MPVWYDITECCKEFLKGGFGKRRNELMAYFSREFRDNRVVKELLVEIAVEVQQQGLNPVQALALAMSYGMTIGVILEEEKNERTRRIV